MVNSASLGNLFGKDKEEVKNAELDDILTLIKVAMYDREDCVIIEEKLDRKLIDELLERGYIINEIVHNFVYITRISW